MPQRVCVTDCEIRLNSFSNIESIFSQISHRWPFVFVTITIHSEPTCDWRTRLLWDALTNDVTSKKVQEGMLSFDCLNEKFPRAVYNEFISLSWRIVQGVPSGFQKFLWKTTVDDKRQQGTQTANRLTSHHRAGKWRGNGHRHANS